jgi:hypothetical protein
MSHAKACGATPANLTLRRVRARLPAFNRISIVSKRTEEKAASGRLGAMPSARSSCALSPGPVPQRELLTWCPLWRQRACRLASRRHGKLPAWMDKPLALPCEPSPRPVCRNNAWIRAKRRKSSRERCACLAGSQACSTRGGSTCPKQSGLTS